MGNVMYINMQENVALHCFVKWPVASAPHCILRSNKPIVVLEDKVNKVYLLKE